MTQLIAQRRGGGNLMSHAGLAQAAKTELSLCSRVLVFDSQLQKLFSDCRVRPKHAPGAS